LPIAGRISRLLSEYQEEVTLSRLYSREAKAAAQEIAAQLGETDAKPLKQIANIIQHCGLEFAQNLLQETATIEANGGMLTHDGQRRRTPGGVFFYLARLRMPEDIREPIFYAWRVALRRRAEHEASFPEFNWQERAQALQDALANKGEVSDVKVTLIGRPGLLERRQELAVVTMASVIDDELVLPNGVPAPGPQTVTYVVYIAAKQWERVNQALEDPDDELIVNGLCAFDDELGSMAVYATHVTTRRTQRKERKQARQQNDGGAGRRKAGARGTPRSEARRQPVEESLPAREPEPVAPPAPVVDIDLPPGLPPEIAQKLIELHTAAATFRQKIDAISAKPDDQQFGLEMTQRLLKNIEKQIADLEQQHAGKG
jgi:hypothetical protein